MFDIFIKNKKIVVDCFTNNSAIHEFFPIASADEFYPQWWKNMSATMKTSTEFGIQRDSPTIKRCDGILDLYKHGICMPLWSDLIIETTTTDYKYQYSSNENLPIVTHNRTAMGPAFNNYTHLKIHSPWIFEEKTGMDFLFTQPSWNMLDYIRDIIVLPGMVNYRDQGGTHVNMLLPRKVNRIELSAGLPIAHMIPLSDKTIDVRTHLVSDQEWTHRNLRYTYLSSFIGRYKKNVRKIKKTS